MASKEAQLSETFVLLADTLVDDFDIVDLLTMLTGRCVDLLGVDAAGVLLLDERNALHVMAASSDEVRLLELFQLQNEEGPCLDCFHTGRAVIDARLDAGSPWPSFGARANAAGFKMVHAFPLRLRDMVIGALNLFQREERALEGDNSVLGQAMADVATIAVLQHQAAAEAARVVTQLHHALNSRIAIEQAKGVLAERAGVGMEKAFDRLRRFARDHNTKLSDVATAVVEGSLPPDVLATLLSPKD
jgi:transcriptional regulator with GAF, ATPase, and Fis domain